MFLWVLTLLSGVSLPGRSVALPQPPVPPVIRFVTPNFYFFGPHRGSEDVGWLDDGTPLSGGTT